MPLIALIIVAWTLGRLMMACLSLRPESGRIPFTFAAGLCATAVLVIMLGSVSLAYLHGMLYALALVGIMWELKSYNQTNTSLESDREGPWSRLEKCSLAATVVALFLTLLSALAPVTHWDATVAHIALASDYAREGKIFLHNGNVYSAYPQFMHGLFATAYYNSGEKTVTLLNWSMALLACAAIYELGRRIADRQTGIIAMAILATAPVFMDQAGGVGIDLAFTAITLCALAALVAWRDTSQWGWLLLAALLVGSSCGIRHTGLLTCVLLTAGVVLFAPQQRIRSTLLFGFIGFLATLPWLIRTGLVADNPFFPFELSLFTNNPEIPHIAIGTIGGHETIGTTGGNHILAFLRFPWDIVMCPARYDGWSKSPGGLVLILGIPGLLLAGRRARALGSFSIAGGMAFFFFQRLARYILPFFAPMMVVAAMALIHIRRGSTLACAVLILSLVFGLSLHVAAIHFKIPVLLGRTTQAEYLEERVERYPAFLYANEYCNDGGTLLTVDQRTYYIEGPTCQNHWAMKSLIPLSPSEQYNWLQENQIRYILWPEEFVRESGAISDLEPMFTQWLRDEKHFTLVKRMAIPKPKGTGVEHIAFLRFSAPESGGE